MGWLAGVLLALLGVMAWAAWPAAPRLASRRSRAPNPSSASKSASPVAAARPELLALGDSYTIGEGVAMADTWPAQLARALPLPLALAAPRIIARTGWTSADLCAVLDAQCLMRMRRKLPARLQW